MNAPLSSLRNDHSRSASARSGPETFGPMRFGLLYDSANRQTGLFEQLLSLPKPLPAAAPAYETAPAGHSSEPQSAADDQSNEVHDQREDGEATETEPSLSAEAAAMAANAARATKPPAAEPSGAERSSSVDAPLTADELATKRESEQTVEANAEKRKVAAEASSSNSDPSLSDAGESAAQLTSAAETSQVAIENPQPGGHQLATSVDNAAQAAQVATPSGTDTEQLPDVDQAEQPDAGNKLPELSSEASDGQHAPTSSTSDQDRTAKGSRERREKWYERDAAPQSKTQATLASEKQDAQPAEALRGSPAEDSSVVANASLTPETTAPTGLAVETMVAVGVPSAEGSGLAGAAVAELPSPSSPSPSTSTESSLSPGAGMPSSSRASRGAVAVDGNPAVQQPGDAADLTQQEKMRLIQRVTRSFARLGADGGQINLRLHPPQLGSLNVQVRLEGRSMTAKLTTETGAARDAILENLPILRTRLAEQGFEISQFQVDVASQDNADASQGSNAGDRAFDQAASRNSGGGGRELSGVRRPAPAGSRAGDAELAAIGSGNALRWQAKEGIDIQA